MPLKETLVKLSRDDGFRPKMLEDWVRRCVRSVHKHAPHRFAQGKEARSSRAEIVAAKLLAAPPGPVLIVAAHPDDEVIGATSLLSRQRCLDVLYVTDGAPRQGRFAQRAGFVDRAEYAAARRREAAAALAMLTNAPKARWLGIPDQEVTTKAVNLAKQLVELLVGYEVVVTHAYEGGHPDHDATALSVHAACRLIEENGDAAPSLLEMTGSHRYGGKITRGVFIPHFDAGPVAEFTLTPAELDLKRRMFGCYATQRAVLKKFSLEIERFRAAPRYDFRVAPHRGALLYDHFGWGITGRAWRGNARRALAALHARTINVA